MNGRFSSFSQSQQKTIQDSLIYKSFVCTYYNPHRHSCQHNTDKAHGDSKSHGKALEEKTRKSQTIKEDEVTSRNQRAEMLGNLRNLSQSGKCASRPQGKVIQKCSEGSSRSYITSLLKTRFCRRVKSSRVLGEGKEDLSWLLATAVRFEGSGEAADWLSLPGSILDCEKRQLFLALPQRLASIYLFFTCRSLTLCLINHCFLREAGGTGFAAFWKFGKLCSQFSQGTKGECPAG